MATVGKPLRPITAAARRVRVARGELNREVKEEAWQDRAWEVYDRLGEIFFMTRYRKGIAAKVDYYIAEQENVTDDPIPVEEGEALEAFEALGGANGLRQIVSDLMPHWDVPGEGYVVKFETEATDDQPAREDWRVLSTQELKRKTQTSMVWLDGAEEVGEVDTENVYRVWSPHPRYSKQADSPTRHVLEPAEELILLSREVRARSQSRLNAGVWLIPSGLDLSDYEEEGVNALTGFANELVRKMSRPISDPSDPASLVPWIVEMDKDDIAAAKEGLLSFSRDYETSADDRKELLVRLATGLDLPAEIFLGLADVNHWGQWLITEHAVSRHAAPTIDEILESLTVNWFHPQVNLDPKFVLWRDLSPATIPTDRSELTLKAHDRFLISDDAGRRELDFNEDDAPTPEEIADRLARASARRGGTITNPATPDSGERPGMALVAAAEEVTADELAAIDQSLLLWTVAQADRELDRAIREGGTIDDATFAGFTERLVERIGRAQEATTRYVERVTGTDVVEGFEETDRTQASEMIVAALVGAATAALLTPDAIPDPQLGEIPDSPVPVAAIREALSVAGGGRASFGPDAAELVGNGHRARDRLAVRGYRTLAYRWVYGDPSARAQNFPPHQALDGSTVGSWEDESLRVFGTFPSGDHYRPGDHKGCLCTYVRELTIIPSLVPVG